MRVTSKEDKIEWLHNRIAAHLASMAGLFTEPVKMTIIIRNPAHPDGSRDVMLTDDEVRLAIAAIRRRVAEDGQAVDDG